MRQLIVVFMALMVTCCSSCSKSPERPDTGDKKEDETKVSERNLERAVILIENAAKHYSKDGTTAFSMTYNPFSSKPSDNLVSVWEYTSSIEAVTAAMNSMKAFRDAGNSTVYDSKYETFKSLLARLYAGLEYYKGTFELTSYTGTATWSPYGVHRASSPGTAAVAGIENVYDDQMWIIRELINAWRATGESAYLERAEYLTAYVLDGWDCTLNASGKENGGITWGPGYVTKHACSNSPMITPLVWLHEIYKGKSDEITYGVINADNTRAKKTSKKADWYLEMAVKIYDWQKGCLLRSDGVYDDFMGGYKTGGGQPEYETVNGAKYRKNTALYDKVGPAYSYNSGTMLSGVADLYGATSKDGYLAYAKELTDKSFKYFAKLGATVPDHYTYSVTGNNPWFNDVLLRGYIAAAGYFSGADVCVQSYQDCLDYAWDRFLENNTLPVSLLAGWNSDKSKNNVNLMFTFARAAEYATLAEYQLGKGK